MTDIIYDKFIYGSELTAEQWSKLQYRPINDGNLYSIYENPSFGINKSEIGPSEYSVSLHYNELANCSAEVHPTSVTSEQNCTLSITAPNNVEWVVTSTNSTIIGPAYSDGNAVLEIAEITGNVSINILFNRILPTTTIRYVATEPVSGTWVNNNTDPSINTWDPTTGVGVLYLNEGVSELSGIDNPFYQNYTVTSVNLNNSGLTTIGENAFSFGQSLKDDPERIGWLIKDVNEGMTYLEEGETINFYDDGGPGSSTTHRHGKNLHIIHLIIVPNGMRVSIHLDTIALGSSTSLKIYDGNSIDATDIILNHTGSGTNKSCATTKNICTIKFDSYNVRDKGWEGTISAIY